MATSLAKLQETIKLKLAQAKAEKEALQANTLANVSALTPLTTELVKSEIVIDSVPDVVRSTTTTDKYGNTITYNEKQQQAIETASSGQSCVIIGAAGTGKTTIQKGVTAQLLLNGSVPALGDSTHKFLRESGAGIAICAYTRRATNNIRRNLSQDLHYNCLTIHKLLEFEPVEIETVDEEGRMKYSRIFEPMRTSENPLPPTLKVIIIEEASMVSVELFKLLLAACPHNPQFIFLGDIEQIPPVFGSAILGYAMLQLPVTELTEVYRQALESPILSLAHRILRGEGVEGKEFAALHVPGKLKLHAWKKRIESDAATITLANFFTKALETGVYNPEEDGILIPFNKSCGTDELNKHIATKIARLQFKAVFEIIHGWKKSYYSIGDKCLYEKEDALIKNIYPNPKYTGIIPRSAKQDMDYWGNGGTVKEHSGETDADDMDSFLSFVQSGGPEDGEGKVRAASHCIELQLLDSERTVTISSAGDVEALILGYAITVHKAQGSEWGKVFLCFHHSHSSMIQRELLYTAVTRAKVELYCICEPDTFVKGIERQRIKGATWQEKAEFFKGKLDNGDLQSWQLQLN